MAYPKLPFLFRPYLVRELPGWGKLLNLLGVPGVDNESPRWKDALQKTIRGKNHGYLMELNLADDVDRHTYFIGRYYDLDIQLLLNVLLKNGDTLLDIGANVGNTALHGASLVGPAGRVLAFEPNPECCERFRKQIQLNALDHVILHEVGLSTEDGTLELFVLGGGTIMASFAIDIDVDGPTVRERIELPVRRGDPLVANKIVGGLVIKIDVEGFELHALRGLTATIDTHRPPILSELEPRYLHRAGVDEHQFFEFFHERGYTALAIGIRRSGLQWTLALRPVPDIGSLGNDADLVWLPDDPRRSVLAPYLSDTDGNQ